MSYPSMTVSSPIRCWQQQSPPPMHCTTYPCCKIGKHPSPFFRINLPMLWTPQSGPLWTLHSSLGLAGLICRMGLSWKLLSIHASVTLNKESQPSDTKLTLFSPAYLSISHCVKGGGRVRKMFFFLSEKTKGLFWSIESSYWMFNL